MAGGGAGCAACRGAGDSLRRRRTNDLVAGRPWVEVDNVSRPTMTVYSPTGKNTGAAVVVFPGGGYEILAIDLEGTEVCDWLTSKGITCVLLKYRVPDVRGRIRNWGAYPKSPMALEDAQRTWGWCAFTPPSGTSIRTRSACWIFGGRASGGGDEHAF